MKNLLILLIIFSCTEKQEFCNQACLLSDKYTVDTDFIRTDTLWRDGNLCGRWLDSIREQPEKWIVLCIPDTSYEVWRYVIGPVRTQPTLFH